LTIMRWYVQLSAAFGAMVGESVLDSVAFDLARQGVLYGSEAVQGNTGPCLDVTLAVEAPSDGEAADKASALVMDALSRVGTKPGSYRFESRVMAMAEVEQRMEAAREGLETLAPNSNWLVIRDEPSDKDEDGPPGGGPSAHHRG
jgi:hypothetical protein